MSKNSDTESIMPKGYDFPTSEEAFAADYRISYDRNEKAHVLEDFDGKQYKWISSAQSWQEMVEDTELAQFLSQFDTPAREVKPVETNTKKRKNSTDDTEKANKKPKDRVNTSIYVTGIPLDADFEEIEHVFKKGGLIAKNVDSGTTKIKMYEDENGNFKGDALITYFRRESIQQAILLLDETNFKTGMSGTMRVEEADMSYKKEQQAPGAAGPQKKDGKPKGGRSVQKIKDLTTEMNARLADWSSDDEVKPKRTSKWDHFVVIKNAFTLKEIEEDRAVVEEVREELRDVAEEQGEVTKTIVYDLEPEGVVMIRFKDPNDAQKTAKIMHNHQFGPKLKLKAYVPTGKERYRKSFFRDRSEELSD